MRELLVRELLFNIKYTVRQYYNIINLILLIALIF